MTDRTTEKQDEAVKQLDAALEDIEAISAMALPMHEHERVQEAYFRLRRTRNNLEDHVNITEALDETPTGVDKSAGERMQDVEPEPTPPGSYQREDN